MTIPKRIGAATVSLGVLAGVVYLGILSGQDARFIVWFGIASAIAAPVGLSLLSYAFVRSDADMIQQLSKVPEIERLVREAETQEQKIRLLEEERSRLGEIVRLESRRQAAQDRMGNLERDAVRILHELDSLQQELQLLNEQVGESAVSQEIQILRDRVRARERGDVFLKIGNRVFRIDRDLIEALPGGFGRFTLSYFRILEKFFERFSGRRVP